MITEAEEGFMTIEEHVRGGRLTFTEERCARINEKLDEILNGLHDKNMFVCDLSPKSVLYNPETEEVKLINFENSIVSANSNAKLPKHRGFSKFYERALWNKGERNYPKARDVDMWCKANVIFYCLYGRFDFDDLQDIIHAKFITSSDRQLGEYVEKLLLKVVDKEFGPHNRSIVML